MMIILPKAIISRKLLEVTIEGSPLWCWMSLPGLSTYISPFSIPKEPVYYLNFDNTLNLSQ